MYTSRHSIWVVSGVLRVVNEIFYLLGLVVSYRRFGTTYRCHLQGSSSILGLVTLEDGTDWLSRNVSNYGSVLPSKMEPIVRPETSAKNCQSALRNSHEERRSHFPYCYLCAAKCVNFVLDKSESFENDAFVLALKCWCVKIK
jgi:hypothetical protein